jgi:hypothetical protein
MPVTNKNTAPTKSNTTSAGKPMMENKSASSKKQGAINIKTTSAREKAKNFDEGRRNDANSNEL